MSQLSDWEDLSEDEVREIEEQDGQEENPEIEETASGGKEADAYEGGSTQAGEKDWSEFSGLEGLTDDEGCQLLYSLAKEVPGDLAIVELGVYTGKSICYIGAGARDGNGCLVWGVDLWDTHTNRVRHKKSIPAQETVIRLTAKKQVKELDLDNVTLIRDFSAAYPLRYDGPKVGLLYIDADHTRDAVLADFSAWWDYLAEDAVIVFDDYEQKVKGEYPEDRVRAAVTRLSKQGWISNVTSQAGRFAVCRKGKGNAQPSNS